MDWASFSPAKPLDDDHLVCFVHWNRRDSLQTNFRFVSSWDSHRPPGTSYRASERILRIRLATGNHSELKGPDAPDGPPFTFEGCPNASGGNRLAFKRRCRLR